MWTLIFVFATYTNSQSSVATIVVPTFKNKEACMAAQSALLEQARVRGEYVRMNMCFKGE